MTVKLGDLGTRRQGGLPCGLRRSRQVGTRRLVIDNIRQHVRSGGISKIDAPKQLPSSSSILPQHGPDRGGQLQRQHHGANDDAQFALSVENRLLRLIERAPRSKSGISPSQGGPRLAMDCTRLTARLCYPGADAIRKPPNDGLSC